MTTFAFEIDDHVGMPKYKVTGYVIGRGEFKNAVSARYLVRYCDRGGRMQEEWIDEEDLKSA